MPSRIIVRKYQTRGQFQRDALRMARRGYQVTSVVNQDRGHSVRSCCLIGLFSLLLPRRASLVVTYQLVEAS